MANGNPTFNNPAVFVGAADEPDKQTGSSKMARETKKMPKKMTLREFHKMVRKMVNEALVKYVKEEVQPPAVPARQMVQPPQRVGGKSQPPPVPGQVDINAVLAKRQKGEPLTPQEKRAYLDHIGSQNVAARKQAQDQFAKSGAGQAVAAIEKNPERFMK